MPHRTIFLISLTVLICCAPQSEKPQSESSAQHPAESYELVDFAQFNDTILEAIATGKTWSQDPIEVTRRFLNSAGARSVNILREDDRGERSDSSTIIIVEDGYQDDSVRGMWNWFRLARSTDDTWRIVEVRRAYRCWRGHHLDSFSKELCP
ncbi:hypothetical protein KAU04_03770 [bacterium]|nr:hypothetical protein [bacterium]